MSETNFDDYSTKPRALNEDEQKLWSTKIHPLLTAALPWLIRPITSLPLVSHPGLKAPVGVDTAGRVYLNFDYTADSSPELSDDEYAARCALNFSVGVWRVITQDTLRRNSWTHTTDDNAAWDIAATVAARAPIVDSVTRRRISNSRLAKSQVSIGKIDNADDLISPDILDADSLINEVLSATGNPIDIDDYTSVEVIYSKLIDAFDGSGQGSSSGSGSSDNVNDNDIDIDIDIDSASGSGNGTGNGNGNSNGSDINSPSDLPIGSCVVDSEDEHAADSQGIRSFNDSQLNDLKTATAADIAHHAQAGTALPESVMEWSTTALETQVIDPMIFFNSTVGGHLDHASNGHIATYSRRSRRQEAVSNHVILQGKAAEVKDLYIAVDVSGSMTDDDLRLALTAVEQLGTERGFNIYYFSVSTMQHEVRQLEPGHTPIFDRDQAGTDMRVAFDMFSIYGAQTRMVITDGYTPWPTDVDPGTLTVVAIPTLTEDNFNDICKTVPTFLNPVRLPLEELD